MTLVYEVHCATAEQPYFISISTIISVISDYVINEQSSLLPCHSRVDKLLVNEISTLGCLQVVKHIQHRTQNNYTILNITHLQSVCLSVNNYMQWNY